MTTFALENREMIDRAGSLAFLCLLGRRPDAARYLFRFQYTLEQHPFEVHDPIIALVMAELDQLHDWWVRWMEEGSWN